MKYPECRCAEAKLRPFDEARAVARRCPERCLGVPGRASGSAHVATAEPPPHRSGESG